MGTNYRGRILEDESETAAFQYTPEFVGSGIEVSPITMPLAEAKKLLQEAVLPLVVSDFFKGTRRHWKVSCQIWF